MRYLYVLLFSSVKCRQLTTNPCPSTKCWTLDTVNDVCTFVDDGTCHSLSCTPETMSITLVKEVFDIPTDKPDAFAKPEDANCKPTWDEIAQNWKWDKSLGTCGMEVNSITIDNNLYVKFVSTFARTVLDTVDLNGLNIQYAIPAQVAFTCNYITEITVQSGKININEPEKKDETDPIKEKDPITGESVEKYKPCKTGTCDVGTFSAGFGLDLGGEDKDGDSGIGGLGPKGPIYQGSCITTELKWANKPAGLSMVKFYVKTISITMGSNTINVVEDNCYSKTLGAKRNDDATVRDDSAAPSFKALSISSGNSFEQKAVVAMGVNLCVENSNNNCDIVRENKDCPGRDANGKDNSGYHYTVEGSDTC